MFYFGVIHTLFVAQPTQQLFFSRELPNYIPTARSFIALQPAPCSRHVARRANDIGAQAFIDWAAMTRSRPRRQYSRSPAHAEFRIRPASPSTCRRRHRRSGAAAASRLAPSARGKRTRFPSPRHRHDGARRASPSSRHSIGRH